MFIRACAHICAKAAAKVRIFLFTTKYLPYYFLFSLGAMHFVSL